jgi:hydroxyacylglutathione hydrolase
LEPVLVALARVGIDEVEGVLQGGWEAWLTAELPYASLLVESVEELHGLTESGEPIILDVRSELEWKEGHIPGARHCPTGMLPSIYAELPKGRPIHVLCLSGYRASIAASLLQREGFHVHCVSDGMQTWNAALLPTSQA